MEKLYVDKWFKLPPKEELNKNYVFIIKPKGYGKKRAKNGKPCKKAKKQTSKKSG